MIRNEVESRTANDRPRSGAASIDYVLTLGALFAMSGVAVMMSRSIMKLVYEMTCFFLAWPFM
ncbi:MAG: hypothetical protein JWM11_2035 [Planctomycetaceae bacterium]|nr:hypothetical protein [Planctomycetaceae bacterium]